MASRGTGSHFDSDKSSCTHPSYACFECTRVLVCGYPAEELQEIKATIEAGGGKVHTKLGKLQLPQVIVCGSAGDKTYKEVRKQSGGKEVPAVTKQWVEECNKAKGQVPYARFELQALTGLIISITNFHQLERVALQKLIEQAGGAYSAELYKDRCTHLVCKTATGQKYKAALSWQTLHLVSEAWVHASIKLGYPAPEESHPPPGQALGSAASVPAVAAAAAPTAARAATAPAVLPSIQGGGNSNDSWVAASSSGTAAVCRQQQQQPAAPVAAAPPPAAAAVGRATRSRAAAAAVAVEPSVQTSKQQQCQQEQPQPAWQQRGQQQHAQQPQQQQHQATALPAEVVDPGVALAARYAPLYDEGLVFLERVQLWWCGISSSEQPELRHMLFAFGGVWMPRLNDNITHIMIGSQATSAELLEVKQYLQACNRRIEVVSPAWLHFCITERQLVTDNRGRMALGGLLNHVALGASAAAAGPAAEAAPVPAAAPTGNILGGVFAQSASRSGFPESDPQQQQQQQEYIPEYWLHQPRDLNKVFEGCYFTLAALKGRQKEHEEALEKIRAHGGQIFNHNSTKPPASCPTVFALCPASLPPADERQLTAADSSFRAVHNTCKVTLDWLLACAARRELVRINGSHTPLFAPIRHPLPLPGFDKVSVLISGYGDADQRRTINKLAELLGAKVLDKLTKAKVPSHLIIPRWGPDASPTAAAAKSDELGDLQIKKIRFAQKHGVEMVDSFWLVECMNDGRRIGEEFSRPKGDLGLLPAAAAGGTQAGGASQLPQTQMPAAATQAPAANKPTTAAGTGKCSLPSHRPLTGADGPTGDDRGGVAESSSRPSNWLAAGSSRPSQQQQQQPQLSTQQQQQQQRQPGQDAPRIRKSTRRPLASPGTGSPGRGVVPRSAPNHHLQQQQQQELDQRHQTDQQEEGDVAVVQSTTRSAAAAAALADVGNTLQSSPPGLGSKLAVHRAPVPAVAAVVSGAVGTTTAGVQPAVAAAVQAGKALGGSDGDEDPGLSNILSVIGEMASKPDIVDGTYASQSVLDMPSLQELTGRVGSGGTVAASSGGNCGGTGYSLRGKRKALGGSSGSGGGMGSGNGGSGGSPEATEGEGAVITAAPAVAAKRPRRSNAASAAAAMPPPPARSAGRAAAPPGSRGSGGSRYCPKKGGAAVQESMQMSQQVAYDVGQDPEARLAAAGRRKGHTAAVDEKTKSSMLARLGQLRKQ